MTMAVSVTGLLLFAAGMSVFSRYWLREKTARDLSAMAAMIADRSSAALLFNDAGLAGENLGALRSMPQVVSAAIYREDGSVAASTGRRPGGWLRAPGAPGYRVFEGSSLLVSEPVSAGGRAIGRVEVVYGLAELNRLLRRFILITALILAVATGVTFYLSARLQSFISSPLLALAALAGRVKAEKDYSLRADEGLPGEIGALARAFNGMLETIEAQRAELVAYSHTLEEKVAARTRDIQESERKLENIVQGSPMAIFVMDRGHRITHWNRAIESGIGIKAEEVLGRPFPWRALYPEQRPSLADLVLDGRGEADAAARYPGVKGSRVSAGGLEATLYFPALGDGKWLYATAAPLYDTAGETAGAVETILDVTESKRTEAALRESQSLYQAIFETSGSGTVLIESDTSISYANAEFCRMVGKTPEEVRGSSWTAYVPSPDLEVMLERHKRRREGDPTVPVTYECRLKDGHGDFRSVMLTVKMIAETKRSVVALADITERKKMEASLIEAKEAAQEAVRAKSAFLAVMSHEIRTPLNAVIGMTELALAGELNDEQRRQLRTAHDAGEALLGVINDILDFSKMEAGKLELECSDFEPREIVESAIELTAGPASRKNLELACRVESDVPAVLKGDAVRLRQVLLNLLSNAVKFTEKGEVVLRVGRAPGEEGALRFAVSDTGIGIPETVRRQLFNSFTQADASTTRRYGGTGLGLAIARKIVGFMGGEIGVDSSPGRGSTFWFTVRLAPSESAPRAPLRLPDLAGERALIVDDSAVSREILGSHLSAWGIRHDEAESGAQALELLRSGAAGGAPYTLLLTDMQMAGMDGVGLARAVQAEKDLCGAKVLLLTSLGREMRLAELRAAGIAAALVKPVKASELYEAILAVLGTAAQAAPARAGAEPRGQGRRLKVLLAEDNAVNQDVARMQLREFGLDADLAVNGREAVAAAGRAAYDLILMDCQMPELDGYAATAEIRRLEGGRLRTPIVGMTANALEGDRQKCLAAGMDDYLPKPVKLSDLGAVLKRWTAPLDESRLAELKEIYSKSGPGAMRRLMGKFEEDLGRNLAAIRAAGSAGDMKAMAGAAHTLRGASGNMGAKRLQALCTRLQESCEGGDARACGELAALLEEEAAVVLGLAGAERGGKEKI